MAQLVRFLRPWPTLQQHCCSCATLHYFFSSSLLPPAIGKTTSHKLSLTAAYSAHRDVPYRSRGLRLPNAPSPPDIQVDDRADADSGETKSRNQQKREAQRAVRWGMQLASFSTRQIKRILKVAALDKDVFDAIILVQRLGPDVREGKRRQFNYIGKLLRDVQPELMDGLIQATKDGDQSKLQDLSGLRAWVAGDDNDDGEESEELESEEEEEGSHIDIATRWLDGLINKDVNITNEVYSVRSVEFDRQELRKLVRRLNSLQDKAVMEVNEAELNAAVMGARRSLTRFLISIAKQMPTD